MPRRFGHGAFGPLRKRPPAATSTPPPIIMLVAAGQSNVVGVNASVGGTDTDQADIYQWNRHTPGITSDITPLIHVIEETDTVSPAVSAAIQMRSDNPGTKIVIVPVAQSTTSILQSTGLWLSSATPGSGHSLFENMCTVSNATYTAIQSMFPGSSIEVRFHWEQGESDTAGPTYSQYLTALTDLINNARTRITGATNAKFVIGSMLPMRWLPASNAFNQGYADVNQAHVTASLNVSNVYYAVGPSITSPDNIHYQPATTARDMGTRMGTIYTDVVGPTMTSPSTMSTSTSQKLSLALSGSDQHQTFHLNGGADVAQFAISDPYLTPTLTWVSDGTGPANGTYVVGVRARDGKGNFGATQIITITVAATVSPTTFFTSSERGMVWDLSDFSNLYQTIDGTTTAVTATGQVVGYVRDLSPNANHWKAAANDTTRPTLQQDADGKYYLSFDGSNDALHAATPFLATNDGRHTAILGVFGAAPVATKGIIGAYAPTTVAFMEPLQTATTGGGILPTYRNDSSATVVPSTLTGMLDNTNKRVMTSAYAGSAGTAKVRNAPDRPSGGGTGNYTTTSTSVLAQTFTTLTRSTLGARGFSSISGQFAGRIYSGFVINRYLIDNEIKNGEDWVAARVMASALP